MPDDTSTCSTVFFVTWLYEVPRLWRTPSIMLFMSWMYASPFSSSLVLVGSAPSSAMPPPLTKCLPSPGWQMPKASGCQYRKSVVEGKRFSVSVDLGGSCIIKKKKNKKIY